MSLIFFGGCGSGSINSNSDKPATGEPVDNALFPFDSADSVGLCFGNNMRYPFSDSRNYVQVLAGNNPNEPLFTYSVNGDLTIKMNDDLNSFTNVCIRIYSTVFDDKAVGDKVSVKLKLKFDPDAAWDVFVGLIDENGQENHIYNSKLPKNGEFEQFTFTTCISDSDAFYSDEPNSTNRKNVQISFFRLTADEMFGLDSIDFEF